MIIQLTVRNGEISKPTCNRYVYDRNFCIKVCELQENDPCIATGENGVDECGIGLQCLPIDSSISLGNTCQYPASYMQFVSNILYIQSNIYKIYYISNKIFIITFRTTHHPHHRHSIFPSLWTNLMCKQYRKPYYFSKNIFSI